MNSISKKFTALNLICILLFAFLFGGVGFWFISNSETKASEQILKLTCRQEANSLNQELHGIQSAINVFSEIAEDRLASTEILKSEATRAGYLREMEKLMADFARNTTGVGAYYLRIDPDLIRENEGFLYTKDRTRNVFEKCPLTDILQYNPADTEHIGWYYQPKFAKSPVWTEPYYNDNLNMYIITYAVPLYKNDVFFGVAGIDVDFNAMANDVSVISPYRTGTTGLVSEFGKVYYHPELENGTLLTVYSPELEPVVRAMKSSGQEDYRDTYDYSYKGTKKKLSFSRLQNGMVLIHSAETSEINASRNTLLKIILLTAGVLAVLAMVITVVVSGRITRPLKKLAEAADQIAAGNMDVELPEPGNDEVGTLIRSFAVTVKSLKKYISGMQYVAYSDPLTHVKNKAAYEVARERLEKDMRGGTAEYGILMLDVNNLKKINDNYGHERGDEYLINCCQMICRVFQHSPVYRIGGDEFVVLLEKNDYHDAENLIKRFNSDMEKTWEENEPWKQVSVSKGLAVCLPSDSAPEEVFKRADQAMYEDKRKMKVTR
jgi:diguanylate cyclase (GGDEF)-like protein